MLRDYEPNDWKTDCFELKEDKQGNPEINAALSFPCCCCKYSHQDEQSDPCHRCGHNCNSSVH